MPARLSSHATRALAFLLRPIYGGIGCIICLHRVIPSEERSSFAENRALEITRSTLREILAWVQQRGLEPIALNAVPERLARPRRRKFVAFTLDDGYRDNLTYALPIFREFDVPFAIYVTTGFLSGTATPWWYALEGLLVARRRLSFAWKEQTLAFDCDGEDCRDQAFREIATLIRATEGLERVDLLQALFSATEDGPSYAKSLMLSWRELRSLASERLVTIGAHGVAHPTLNHLPETDAWNELASSKRDLEARLGQEVRHFAYPFGGRNSVGPREFQLAAKCGYSTAVTTRSGNLFPAHAEHLHCLPRLGLSGNYPAISRLRKLESGLLTAAAQRGRRVVLD